jgi:hypothetical protein
LNTAGVSKRQQFSLFQKSKIRCVLVESGFFSGIWIPFQLALHLAYQTDVTDLFYPLFEYDIKRLVRKYGFVDDEITKAVFPWSSEYLDWTDGRVATTEYLPGMRTDLYTG